MRENLKRLPQDLQDLIKLAADISARQGVSAYLVGGFVRDLILGVKNLDLDIVVEGDAIRFADELAYALKARIISHKRFGTATVITSCDLKVDFATARKEIYPKPASLPLVSPGTLKDDLFRRDFSINAMAISLGNAEFGMPIDLYNGQKDLKNKRIRVLHDLSFIDDPTRILRAIRFEQRYGFKIEPHALGLLKEAVKLGMLQKVQPQRLRDELILLLKETHPFKPIKRINELGLFGFVSPKLSVSAKTYALLESVDSQVKRFKKTHHGHRQLDTWVTYFMALLDSVSIPRTRNICARFVFRKGEEKRIMDYKKINRRFIRLLSRNKIKPSQAFGLLKALSYEVMLLLKAKYKNAFLRKNIDNFISVYNSVRIYTCGEDLKEIGLKPGPQYQRIFAKLLNAKLDGSVNTKEEELVFIKKLIKQK